MMRATLTLMTASLISLTGCMTEADKALWAEAKETLGGHHEKVAEEPILAPDAAVESEASSQHLKTSKELGETKDSEAKGDETAKVPKESDSPELKKDQAN